MKNKLASEIAFRYLFSKKSHSAVNKISIISICGVAVATMAIVCVLSVFNGFQTILSDKVNSLAPDIQISASDGKVIANSELLMSSIEKIEGVKGVMPVIQDNALAVFKNRQMPITLLGVDELKFGELTSISSLIKSDGAYQLVSKEIGLSVSDYESKEVDFDEVGEFDESMLFASSDVLYEGDDVVETNMYHTIISVGVANQLLARPNADNYIHLFTPRRLGGVNLGNPATAFMTDSVNVAGVFQSEQVDYDADYMVVDIKLARQLLQYEQEATYIDVALERDANILSVIEQLQQEFGADIVIKDRIQQQELNYRMINIEKWITFLLLAFILIVASFNLISTLSMLIIEKDESIAVFYSLGASKKFVGRIFAWESFYVNAIGSVGGIIVGLILCLLQQYFGFIKLNGNEANLIITAYPIKVELMDILIVLLPVALIAFVTSVIASRFAKSRLSQSEK